MNSREFVIKIYDELDPYAISQNTLIVQHK